MAPDTAAACPEAAHDWRIDPFVQLLSHPPQRRLVCADCGKVSARPMETLRCDRDPRTWPRA